MNLIYLSELCQLNQAKIAIEQQIVKLESGSYCVSIDGCRIEDDFKAVVLPALRTELAGRFAKVCRQIRSLGVSIS